MSKASDNPVQYGQQEAYEAFEWLRQHATTHGAVALCEWHRLALENKRLTAELARWEKPFDEALLADTRKQASRADSLAAMRVYNTALEHALKHKSAEADANRKDAERWRTAKSFAPETLCAIAWRVRAACAFDEPDAAMDAAREGGK